MGGQTDAMKNYRANQMNVGAGNKMSQQEAKTYAQLESQGMSGATDESPQRYAKMIGSLYSDLKNQAAQIASPNLFGRDTSAPAIEENANKSSGGMQFKKFPTQHPNVKNPDGSMSNVKLGTFEVDGMQYVIPTMVGGKQLSGKEAFETAKQYGFDKYPSFKTAEEADAWARKYHGSVMPDGTIKY